MPADDAAHRGLQLAGSEQRAYEHVVRTFIGAWDNVLRPAGGIDVRLAIVLRSARLISAVGRHSGGACRVPKEHPRNTADPAASAIWNEDETGAECHRDCLLRWDGYLRSEMHRDHVSRIHHALSMPYLLPSPIGLSLTGTSNSTADIRGWSCCLPRRLS